LKRSGKPYTDKEQQSVGHVVMIPRKRIPETNFKTADAPWIEWVWTICSSANMTSYLLKEHRYVRTDDLSTPKAFRSLPARQQRMKTHIVGKRGMRRGETRITRPRGHLPKKTLQNRGLLRRILFRTGWKIRDSDTAKERQRRHRRILFRPLKLAT